MSQLNATETLPAAVCDAADALAAALSASRPFVAYAAAEEALAADASATALLEQFSSAQRDLRVRQDDGSITQFDLDRVRTLQRQLEASVPISDYIAAQQQALSHLPRVNGTVSELLGLNFAQLARRSSCC